MAIISTGIKLSYKAGSGEFIPLEDLYEIPELGGDVDKIEITTLESTAHEYTNGIKNYGDTIAFKFYYEKDQFTTLSGLGACDWKVELPDGVDGALGTSCTFSGVPSVKLDGVSYNAALTYSLNIAPTSEMKFA